MAEFEPIGEVIGIERLRELLPHMEFEQRGDKFWMRVRTLKEGDEQGGSVERD